MSLALSIKQMLVPQAFGFELGLFEQILSALTRGFLRLTLDASAQHKAKGEYDRAHNAEYNVDG